MSPREIEDLLERVANGPSGGEVDGAIFAHVALLLAERLRQIEGALVSIDSRLEAIAQRLEGPPGPR